MIDSNQATKAAGDTNLNNSSANTQKPTGQSVTGTTAPQPISALSREEQVKKMEELTLEERKKLRLARFGGSDGKKGG